MSAARIIGGLLTGMGRGMELQETARRQEERDEALFRRQQALARYGHDLDMEREGVAQTHRLQLDTHQTKNRMVSTEAELGVRGRLAAEDDQREAVREVSRENRQNREWDRRQEVDYNQWRQRHGIEESSWRERQRYLQELDPDRTIQWFTRDDGMRVGYVAETGETIETGMRVRENDPDDFGRPEPASAPTPRRGMVPGGTQSPPRRIGGTLSPRPPAPAATNTYTDDDVVETMRANRMTRAQAIQAIEARGFRRAS